MGFLSESDQKDLRERFQDLPNPVEIIFFTQELECPHCQQTGLLLENVRGGVPVPDSQSSGAGCLMPAMRRVEK